MNASVIKSATVFPLRLKEVIWTALNLSGTWGVRRSRKADMWREWKWSWVSFDPGFSLAGLMESNQGQTWFGWNIFSTSSAFDWCASATKQIHTGMPTEKKDDKKRSVAWRGDRGKRGRRVGGQWMINEQIIELVRVISTARMCSCHTLSVSHSVCDMWCMTG